jgi:uncharacterized protein
MKWKSDKPSQRESGKLGGKKRAELAAPGEMSAVARLGGEATKRKYGPEYYREIGRKGGAANAAKRDRAHFQRIGALGGQKVKEAFAAQESLVEVDTLTE